MSTEQLLEELKRQVVNLDVNKYKVLVIWDPVSSKDVGWLTVKKDVEVKLSRFQGRDVNLRALDGIKTAASSTPKQSAVTTNSFQATEQGTIDSSISLMGSTNFLDLSQEVIEISNDSMENFPAKDLNENIRSIKTELVSPRLVLNPFSASVSSSNILSLKPRIDQEQKINQWRSGVKRQCPHCSVQVSPASFVKHLRAVHNLQPEKEQVTCDICGIPVFKVNLEFHKSVAHSVKKESETNDVKKFKCSCGNKYSTAAGLNQHKSRFCGKPITINPLLARVNELRRQKKLADEGLIKSSSTATNLQMETIPGDQGSSVDKGDSTARKSEWNKSADRKEKVKFEITYQDRSYSCSRSKDRTIKASLKKFCKETIGEELRFEFRGKPLTGTEGAEDFEGGKIFAINLTRKI